MARWFFCLAIIDNMFVKKEKIITNLKQTEIIRIFEENIFTHSPILNSKDINSANTKKAFLGEIKERKLLFWENADKKRVIVPLFAADILEDEKGSILEFKITLPYHNRVMLKFWFLLLGAYCALNLCYLPFSISKFVYFLNFVSGAVFFFCSFFFVNRILKKRVKECIDKIKEMLKICL